jgi:hypothetical protein
MRLCLDTISRAMSGGCRATFADGYLLLEGRPTRKPKIDGNDCYGRCSPELPNIPQFWVADRTMGVLCISLHVQYIVILTGTMSETSWKKRSTIISDYGVEPNTQSGLIRNNFCANELHSGERCFDRAIRRSRRFPWDPALYQVR